MTNLQNISPVLPVLEMKAEMEFFESLGFANIYNSLQYSDTLDYAVMARDRQTIHLQLFGEQPFDGQQIKIWVNDLDAIATELDSGDITYNRHDYTPWETSEIGLYSPSRHALFFVKDLAV